MKFKQFYLGCLAHASYYIGSGEEAAIVDPQRDVQQYLDEAEANGTEWVLARIPSAVRRKTLIARKEAGEVPRYVLDIKLQGENETVFFDL